MHTNAQNSAAAAYTLNAIAAIVRREGAHDYARGGIGAEVASLCGVTVSWKRDGLTLSARDVDVVMQHGAITFARGDIKALQGWHRVLADLDNVFLRRAA
ncbi:MAG: hypothetical protein KKA05_01120 [Alphaproteobacteria bacterium]|nr:hypothetical protein [Alphaproteobacteria bacterium]MBU0859965.1 hypothetical protein [Alphaproteobacteria bacterium]